MPACRHEESYQTNSPIPWVTPNSSTELSSQVNALYSGKAAEAELDVAVAWPVKGINP